MNTAQAPHVIVDSSRPAEITQLRVYDHTPLLYWWPVWVLGYALAFWTWAYGDTVSIGNTDQLVLSNQNLGVVFCVVTFLVILMTNVVLRGLVSGIVIITLLFMTLLLAYFGLWDDILDWLGSISVHMNMGFYVFFSTLIFIAWALSVFVFDRLDYWTFRPGQAEHFQFFGGGTRTFDTRGMSVYKLRDDLFRHWLLGLGAGDIHITTSGNASQEIVLHNVLWVNAKIRKIQTLVAIKPDEMSDLVQAGHAE